jgi:hypothetical protein
VQRAQAIAALDLARLTTLAGAHSAAASTGI